MDEVWIGNWIYWTELVTITVRIYTVFTVYCLLIAISWQGPLLLQRLPSSGLRIDALLACRCLATGGYVGIYIFLFWNFFY
jgi:hypothetical protein